MACETDNVFYTNFYKTPVLKNLETNHVFPDNLSQIQSYIYSNLPMYISILSIIVLVYVISCMCVCFANKKISSGIAIKSILVGSTITVSAFIIVVFIFTNRVYVSLHTVLDPLDRMSLFFGNSTIVYLDCVSSSFSDVVSRAADLPTSNELNLFNSAVSDVQNVIDIASQVNQTMLDVSEKILSIKGNLNTYVDIGSNYYIYVTYGLTGVVILLCLTCFMIQAFAQNICIKSTTILYMFFTFILAIVCTGIVFVSTAGADFCKDPYRTFSKLFLNESTVGYYIECGGMNNQTLYERWPWKSEKETVRSNLNEANSLIQQINDQTLSEKFAIYYNNSNQIFDETGPISCSTFKSFFEEFLSIFCNDIIGQNGIVYIFLLSSIIIVSGLFSCFNFVTFNAKIKDETTVTLLSSF